MSSDTWEAIELQRSQSMIRYLMVVAILLSLVMPTYAKRTSDYYGAGLCKKANYKCVTIKRGQSWERMFPDALQRDLVQRLNRSDTYLHRGRKIVVPVSFENLTMYDISPFPLKIKKTNEKMIIVNQNLLAWGAYNVNGELVYWGPISSGKDYCRDIGRSCRTVTGIFYVFSKKGEECRSNIYPVGRGGSKMPYCMFFHKGYALHGSNQVRGYRDSHGCVRLFTRDAKWLNHNFVEIIHGKWDLGTKVVVQKLIDEK